MKTIRISKTTNQNLKYLYSVLADLNKGIDFILRENTVVARISRGTTTNEYHCPNSAMWNVPAFIQPITKDIGSDLCALYNAKQKLERFLLQANKPS